jgi:hypothetical protein
VHDGVEPLFACLHDDDDDGDGGGGGDDDDDDGVPADIRTVVLRMNTYDIGRFAGSTAARPGRVFVQAPVRRAPIGCGASSLPVPHVRSSHVSCQHPHLRWRLGMRLRSGAALSITILAIFISALALTPAEKLSSTNQMANDWVSAHAGGQQTVAATVHFGVAWIVGCSGQACRHMDTRCY